MIEMKHSQQLKEEIKKAIEHRFGEINDYGCYSGKDWLSTERLFDLICNTIDENDYLFGED
jgi:hypothetical protein